jgi:hypothetical protein
LFAIQERLKVVFADQPAASCLYRSELAGAQEVGHPLAADAERLGDLGPPNTE